MVALGLAAVAAGSTLAVLSGGGGSEGPTGPVLADSYTASDGGFTFHLIQARCGYEVVRTATRTVEPENGEFCLASADVTYRGSGPGRLREDCQYLVDAGGTRHRMRPDVIALDELSASAFGTPLSPGESAAAVGFYFDVPGGIEAASLELHSSCASRGVRFPLE